MKNKNIYHYKMQRIQQQTKKIAATNRKRFAKWITITNKIFENIPISIFESDSLTIKRMVANQQGTLQFHPIIEIQNTGKITISNTLLTWKWKRLCMMDKDHPQVAYNIPIIPAHTFLLELLMDKTCQNCISWAGKGCEYKFTDPDRVSRPLSMRKNIPKMSYEKRRQGLCYYYIIHNGKLICKCSPELDRVYSRWIVHQIGHESWKKYNKQHTALCYELNHGRQLFLMKTDVWDFLPPLSTFLEKFINVLVRVG